MYGLKEGEVYEPWKWPVPVGGVIGKRGVRRKDGYEKATGRATYTRDVYRPGMLYAKFLECPYPHAKIKSMDTSKAEAYPGVKYIIRWDDPELYWRNMLGDFGTWSEAVTAEAHWAGQPIGALLAADSEAIVDEALKLIKIEWEELPWVVDWEKALEPGAPIVRPDKIPDSNQAPDIVTKYGDVEAGFKEATKIIEFIFRKDEHVWAGVEPHSGVAEWKGDFLEVWQKSQAASSVHSDLKRYTTMDKICVHASYLGAQFGGLQWFGYSTNFPNLPVLLAKRTQKPVKMLYDGSHFYGNEETTGTYKFKVGFKDDGKITAVDCIVHRAGATLTKIYEGTSIVNLQNTKRHPRLNRGGTVCHRHGGPSCVYMTQVFAHVAAELKMDPTVLALKNDGCKGKDMAYINENVKKPQGFDSTRDSLNEVITAGKKAIDWDKNYHLPGTKILPNGKYHGIGFAHCHTWDYSPGRYRSGLTIQADGTVSIVGRQDDGGWNPATCYCRIVASELGYLYEDVSHRPFDQVGGLNLNLVPGMSSVGMVTNGVIMVRIARKMRELILGYAKDYAVGGVPVFPTGTTAQELDILNGNVFLIAKPETKVSVKTVAATNYANLFVWDYPPAIAIATASRAKMGRQCYFYEVEVDPETGMVEVKKVVVAYDCGRLLDPDSEEGQMYGGTYMAAGSCLMEAVHYCPQTGLKLNDNLIGYPIALMNDCGPIDVKLIETGFGYGAYGLFGGSESPGAMGFSMGNVAVYNAIGKWVDLPATPDKILKALGKA